MQKIPSFLNAFNNIYSNIIAQMPYMHDPERYFNMEIIKFEIGKLSTIEKCDELAEKIKCIAECIEPEMIMDLETLNKIEHDIKDELVNHEDNNEEEKTNYVQFCNERLILLNYMKNSIRDMYKVYANQDVLLRELVNKKMKEIALDKILIE